MPCARRVFAFAVVLAAGLAATAAAHQLYPNSPDPFCPATDGTTRISYDLGSAAHVRLTIRDPFGHDLAHLEDEREGPGSHSYLWNGQDDFGVTPATARFRIVLDVDGEQFSDDCTVLCGNGLNGPLRDAAGPHDIQMAFFVGLESAQSVQLRILNAAGTLVVRTLANAPCPAGVSTFVWDLKNQGGARVAAGDYLCRITSAVLTTDIPFAANPIQPLSVSCRVVDARGAPLAGSLDPAHPTVLETPLQTGEFLFGRRLDAYELDAVLDDAAQGGFSGIEPGFVRVGPDTTWVYYRDLRPPSGATWSDVYGDAWFVFDSAWVTPSAQYFHLQHTFEGITATNSECERIGNFDPDDWACASDLGPDKADPVPVGPPTVYLLDPACPNPVVPGGALRLGYGLPVANQVVLRVIDTHGEVVRTLDEGERVAGRHITNWDLRSDQGTPLAPGMYRAVIAFGDTLICGGDIAVTDDPVAVIDPGAAPTARPRLTGCWPNPFNPATTVAFTLPRAGHVRLEIFDAAGRRVRLLLDEEMAAGDHRAAWNGTDGAGRRAASGIYFCRLESGTVRETRRLVLVE